MKPNLIAGSMLMALATICLALSAQIPTDQDCLGAIPVCEGYYYQANSYSGQGNYPNEIPTSGGCPGNCLSSGESNCVWYYVTVQSDGMMGFEITPNNFNDDYDWAVYDLTDARCEDIYSQVEQLQVSCNYSATKGMTGPNGGSSANCLGVGGSPFCAMIPVQEGEIYVINISSLSSSQSGYSLDFTISTAQIYDDVPPEIVEIYDDVVECNTNTLTFRWSENMLCDSVTPMHFDVTGPGGPYVVTDVVGVACALGGTRGKEFTLYVDPPFANNGNYELEIYSVLSGIVDACNNPAEAAVHPFTLDLGAPELDESGLAITGATCGMDNGSITGLSASGQTSLIYIWKNSYGTVVANTLDLVDAPAGNYTLEVHDLQPCILYGGPYEITGLGAPEVDDTNIQITASNYGANNGSITGITVSSLVSISEYIWMDESSIVVGSDLDLSDVPSGYYTLTIVDENTCEAYAGPYFVDEIGGPLTTNPSASTNLVCAGEQVVLSPGADGGSGSYTYTWTSTPAGFNSTLQTPVVVPMETTTYHLQLFDGYILAYGSVTITVQPVPEIDLGGDIHYVCVHETITLDAGNPGSAYLWSNGDTNKTITLATTGLGNDEQQVSVNVTNAEGCQDEVGVTIIFDYDYCVGIEEIGDGIKLKVFPNPTPGKLNISMSGVKSDLKLDVRNTIGSLLEEYDFHPDGNGMINEEIDLTGQVAGIYFLIFRADDQTSAVKVLLK